MRWQRFSSRLVQPYANPSLCKTAPHWRQTIRVKSSAISVNETKNKNAVFSFQEQVFS